MEAICLCRTSLRSDSQLKLSDKVEYHLVNHCRNEATFKTFSARIEKALANILSGLKSDNERKQLISDLKMISRSCFVIGEYPAGPYNRFGLSASQAHTTYERAAEMSQLIAPKLEHL